MISTRVLMAASISFLVVFLAGCASSTSEPVNVEAEPVSVRVVPSPPPPTPSVIAVETELACPTNGTWELRYYYDVRDPKGTGTNRHLDPDDYLVLDEAACRQFVPTGTKDWPISILLREKRPVEVEVYVTVVAEQLPTKKGVVGKATVPAAP